MYVCVCGCDGLARVTVTVFGGSHVTRYAAINPKQQKLLCVLHPHMHTHKHTHILRIRLDFCCVKRQQIRLYVLYYIISLSACLFLIQLHYLLVLSACHLFAFFAVAMFGHHPHSPSICDVFLTRFHFSFFRVRICHISATCRTNLSQPPHARVFED